MTNDHTRPFVTRDAVLAGLLKAFGLEVKPLPEPDGVYFCILGDVAAALGKVAQNGPIGSRDVLEGIKSARSMIFTFKGASR